MLYHWNKMINWKEEIEEEVTQNNDVLIACTLSLDEAMRKFDDGFGGTNGQPFTAWGEKYVYFPISFAGGSESVGSAPRFPESEEVTWHHGGG